MAALLPACNQKSSQSSPPPQVYIVKGVIKKLEADGKTAVIRHEAIPGYMQAMTMPFEARDLSLIHISRAPTATREARVLPGTENARVRRG